jgi:hypothetical protein
LIGSCAATKKAVSESGFFETWSGTWVTTDTPISEFTPQKLISHPDGTQKYYSLATNTTSAFTSILTLTDRWADSKGNIWYKAHKRREPCDVTIHEYGKISDSGNTLELLYHAGSIQVEEWDPDNPVYNYVVYYRL